MADIRHSIQISAAPETVYQLAATAAGFAQWWAEDVTEDDGRVDLGFFNRTTTYRLKPIVEAPSERIEWRCESGREWAGTELQFHMIAAGSGTLLRFTHADWEAETDYFVSCTTAWGELMFRLKAAAEGKPRGPLFLRAALAY
ncbi:MAG: SRPBCC family protein [Bryobacteraceae bacterium]